MIISDESMNVQSGCEKVTYNSKLNQVSLPEKILVAYSYSWERKLAVECDLNIDRLWIRKEED